MSPNFKLQLAIGKRSVSAQQDDEAAGHADSEYIANGYVPARNELRPLVVAGPIFARSRALH